MCELAASDIVFGGALAFLAGVAAASLDLPLVTVIVIVAIAGFVVLFSFRALRFAKFLSLLLLLLFAGAFYYHLYLNIQHQRENIPYSKVVAFSATITDEPKIYDKYQNLSVELEPPLAGSISVLISPLENYKYGDLLQIEGEIEPAQSAAEKPTAAFPKTITVMAEHRGFWLKEKLLDIKSFFVSQLASMFGADKAALLTAITFGARLGFSPELKNQITLSGTTYLTELSGYNISILVLVVSSTFGYFLSRRKAFCLTVFLIAILVLMAGGRISVVRAAVMGLLAILAKEAGRIYSMRNSITLTALAMVILDPTILVQAAFLLSFVGLLGVTYLGPALKNVFKLKDAGFAGWKENAVITLAAQLAVMPLAIQVFGSFSLTAIAANVLILEFIPLTMLSGFLLAAIGSLYYYFGFLIAKLVDMLLSYEILVIKFFAGVRLPVSPSLFGSQLATALYYGSMVIFIYCYSYRKNEVFKKAP